MYHLFNLIFLSLKINVYHRKMYYTNLLNDIKNKRILIRLINDRTKEREMTTCDWYFWFNL